MSNTDYIEVVGDITNLSYPQQAKNGKYYYTFILVTENKLSIPCIAFSGAFDKIEENYSEGDTCLVSGSKFEFKGDSVLNVHRINRVI